jgi:hypothetical protein
LALQPTRKPSLRAEVGLDSDAMLHAMIASFDGEKSELTAVINGLIS